MPPKPKPRLEWNDPDIQIVPKRERKKVYRPTIDRIEKGLKKTIANLRGTISNKNTVVRQARRQRDKAKENKKAHTKRAVYNRVARERFMAKRYIAKMWDRKWEFANTIMKNRVKKIVLNNSKYLDGISSFPIIYSWCKEHKIDPATFGIFVLINHYEWFTSADGIFFGHSKLVTTRHLKKLVLIGLVDEISNKRKAYVSSTLGKKTFREFKKYHDNRMEELMKAFSDAFKGKEDALDFKKYRKIVKPEQNGNQQKDTE